MEEPRCSDVILSQQTHPPSPWADRLCISFFLFLLLPVPCSQKGQTLPEFAPTHVCRVGVKSLAYYPPSFSTVADTKVTVVCVLQKTPLDLIPSARCPAVPQGSIYECRRGWCGVKKRTGQAPSSPGRGRRMVPRAKGLPASAQSAHGRALG